MSNYKTKWTPEQDAMLIRLWCQEGFSSSGIAARIHSEFRINLTRNAVMGRIHRLRLIKSSGPSPEAKASVHMIRQIAQRNRKMPSKPRISLKKSPVSRETKVEIVKEQEKPVERQFYVDAPDLVERLDECQFILNDNSPWQFCHAPSNGSWCSEHKARVFQPSRTQVLVWNWK